MYQSLARYRASQGAAWNLRRSLWSANVSAPPAPCLPEPAPEPEGEASHAPADTSDS